MRLELVPAPHVEPAQLERFAARELSAEEIRAIQDHLRACSACAVLARDRARASLGGLRRGVEAEVPAPLEHPDREELVLYARGRADRVQSELIASHLEECGECAGAVGGLKPALRYAWIAAAAVLVAILTVLMLRRPAAPAAVVIADPPRTAVVTPPRAVAPAAQYADAGWDALVREAKESGRLPLPSDLGALRRGPDVARGVRRPVETLQPAGRVIAEVRPELSWTARDSATYIVYVYDGEREIARSGTLRETRWTPPRALPRGRLLTWQVEAARGESIETLPRPPAPPAVFRIAREEEWRDVVRAREAHPGDDLLLGILYARAGMLDEAGDALRRAAASDPAARKLLDQLE
ncbi:MAG TPA: zf-HC2 domain-containing protein [Thermoanaerobaculia bacterium]|nr:zf-HC2 domain-containing protein [Thermoanaerobaculia bacterium]